MSEQNDLEQAAARPAEPAQGVASQPAEPAVPEHANEAPAAAHEVEVEEKVEEMKEPVDTPDHNLQGDKAGAPIAPDGAPNGEPSGGVEHPERAEQADPMQPQHQIPVEGDLQDPDAEPADMSAAPTAAEADAEQREVAERFAADRFERREGAPDGSDLELPPPGAGTTPAGYSPTAATQAETRRATEVGEQQAQTPEERLEEESKIAYGAGAPPVAGPLETPENPELPDEADYDEDDDEPPFETPEDPADAPSRTDVTSGSSLDEDDDEV